MIYQINKPRNNNFQEQSRISQSDQLKQNKPFEDTLQAKVNPLNKQITHKGSYLLLLLISLIAEEECSNERNLWLICDEHYLILL